MVIDGSSGIETRDVNDVPERWERSVLDGIPNG